MSAQELKHQARLNEWRMNVERCRSSGQTVREWCKEQGICVQTYYRWEREILSKVGGGRQRLEQEGIATRNEATFVEIESGNETNKNDLKNEIAEVQTSRGRIRIFSGASPEAIKALCEAFLC